MLEAVKKYQTISSYSAQCLNLVDSKANNLSQKKESTLSPQVAIKYLYRIFIALSIVLILVLIKILLG